MKINEVTLLAPILTLCFNRQVSTYVSTFNTYLSVNCTQGGSRTLTHKVHYDLNVARLPIPALGYKSYSNVNNLINIKSFLININFNNEENNNYHFNNMFIYE